MNDSIFKNEVKKYQAKQKAKERAQQKNAERAKKELEQVHAMMEAIPKVIHNLITSSLLCGNYFKEKIMRHEDIHPLHLIGFPEDAPRTKTYYHLARVNIPTRQYSESLMRDVDTALRYHIIMNTEGSVSKVGVYISIDRQRLFSKEGRLKEVTGMPPREVVKKIELLANPKTALQLLFDEHPPVKQ